jgi:hypothetical protein
MKEQKQTTSLGVPVRTALKSGYWTCTGVYGTPDATGVVHGARASVCYKPKYAPIFGAPAFPGGGDN